MSTLRGIVWDWGDTLMRVIPGQTGPMVEWPHVEAMPGALVAVASFPASVVHCVASNAANSDGAALAAALDRIGLRSRVTHLFTSGELGVEKPDPAFRPGENSCAPTLPHVRSS